MDPLPPITLNLPDRADLGCLWITTRGTKRATLAEEVPALVQFSFHLTKAPHMLVRAADMASMSCTNGLLFVDQASDRITDGEISRHDTCS